MTPSGGSAALHPLRGPASGVLQHLVHSFQVWKKAALRVRWRSSVACSRTPLLRRKRTPGQNDCASQPPLLSERRRATPPVTAPAPPARMRTGCFATRLRTAGCFAMDDNGPRGR